MASVLVDYENVCMCDGLRGVEFLMEQDSLYVFYSVSCRQVKSRYMESIRRSNCDFQICMLKKTGKNALDFYIAVQCGMLVGRGETEIVIVSRDKGFAAVTDFLENGVCGERTRVVRSANVEDGLTLIRAADNEERKRLILEKNKMLDIKAEYAKLAEQQKFRKKMITAFGGTGYEEVIDEVIEMLDSKPAMSRKELYTGAMHRFGITKGREIYKVLRNVV